MYDTIDYPGEVIDDFDYDFDLYPFFNCICEKLEEVDFSCFSNLLYERRQAY